MENLVSPSGSSYWAAENDDVKRWEHTEESMVRQMCDTTVRDGKTYKELRGILGIEHNSEIHM